MLTRRLSKESREAGYTLGDDEDFLYLSLNGKLVSTWTISGGVTIEDVEKFIRGE